MSPEAIAAIIGLFMPIVVSLLKRPTWPTWARLAVAGAVSLVVGVISTAVSGDLHLDEPGNIFTSAAAAFTAATVVYKAWFQATPINEKLEQFPL